MEHCNYWIVYAFVNFKINKYPNPNYIVHHGPRNTREREQKKLYKNPGIMRHKKRLCHAISIQMLTTVVNILNKQQPILLSPFHSTRDFLRSCCFFFRCSLHSVPDRYADMPGVVVDKFFVCDNSITVWSWQQLCIRKVNDVNAVLLITVIKLNCYISIGLTAVFLFAVCLM